MRSLYITVRCTLVLFALNHSEVYAQGQQGSGSPYSAYGFGDLFNNTQVTQSLMGISGVGTADLFSVAAVNPASYVGIARPIFEAGGVGRIVTYELDGVKGKGQRTDLLGLSIGVPFAKNKWGFAIGVAPFSNVGYKINNYDTLIATGGRVRYEYSGSGGLNIAFLGLSRVLWQTNDTMERGKKLSFGVNINYLFGTVEETRKAYYPTNGGYYNTNVTSTLVVRAPTVNLGFQFTGDLVSKERVVIKMAERRLALLQKDQLREQDWINAGKDPEAYKHIKIHNRQPEAFRYRFGIASELPTSLAAKHTGLGNSFVSGTSGDFTLDTTFFTQGTRGTVDLPASYSAGFSVYNNRWKGVVEYRLRDWSTLDVNVEGYSSKGKLAIQSIYAIGGSFHPTLDPNASLLLRNTYRFGVRYSDDYLVVGNTQLREMALTGGISIPLGKFSWSRINIGAEYGQRNDAADELLKERFTNIHVGITIVPEAWDQWFKKRRID